MATVIIYYGDPAVPHQLRKIAVRPAKAWLYSRMSSASPHGDRIGELIPEGEEDVLLQAVRDMGGRATQIGGQVRLGDTVTIDDVLALAERLWGPPVATADDYDTAPRPLRQPLHEALREALRAAGFDIPDPSPKVTATAGHGGARPGAGRPEVGKPIPVRLGVELTARVDAARRAGESRAAAIRRLLDERLVTTDDEE